MNVQQSQQSITPELRAWIVAQAEAGCDPQAVLKAMHDSGWDEEVALEAMEGTLREHLAARGAGREVAQPPLRPAASVPEPDLSQSPATLWAGDREVSVVMTLASPRVIVFGGLLSDAECDELIALAEPRLSRSETVDTDTGGSEVNASRTSQGMFFQRGEHPVCARLEQRIATLLRWPVERGEGLQILRYGPGAEYRPHHDYFDPAHAGTPTILKRGGQRLGTVVVYLNTPAKGGATTFPEAGLAVAPVRGNAVFFSYDRPHPATRTLHGGAPVVEGEKWVATKWLREGRFD
ncbi:2OG-Fe(II) oxygenase [Aquabacterium sp. J223]|uniref:2OG-Fe(II) oxygenase n=1 Tax=Aquabacterium sp. J223 TaxID=2898431 RepID=UPI0021AD5DAC|nr:2OG-Fe(II) oxygenase [Aquabacterium sp. J223]UUX94837.1 2OG-Fe(II) oxygenase [Aquabacterium sp. J223]